MNAHLARAAQFVRERYFAVDARTLGLFRICFGLHLIANVYDRTKGLDAIAFYTNLGVMPNHYALFAPMGDHIWSLLFAFSTPAEVQVAFVCILAVYAAYVLGWHTKLAQILAVVCLLSLDNRNLALQNGGIVVTNVVAVWTAFLPLGARFSLDHLRRSRDERPEEEPADLAERAPMIRSAPSYARLAFFAILVNFACIYLFNCLHKKGITWKDGSSVHWVLWQNRIATIWAAWLRMHEPSWLSPAATWGTLAIEAALPFLLLTPIFLTWTRRIAIFLVFALHIGISLMMTLGPFSYSMMAFSLLLITKEDWELLHRWFDHRGPKIVVAYDAALPRLHEAARVVARLDHRSALTFANRGDPHEVPVPDDLAGESLVVFDPVARHWLAGEEALHTIVRALPLGFAYAWIVSMPGVTWWAERRFSGSRSFRRSVPPRASRDAPAQRFVRGLWRTCGETLAAVLFATILTQISMDNWALPDSMRLKHRPEFMREVIEYLRLPQGWSMFSPDAPKDDGTLVIDAVLSDGRHLDPRKQAPPDFEAGYHGPWFDDQQWCDWDLRMKWEGNRHLYPYFKEYIARLDRLHGWKQRASIRSFDVYWVNNAAPPPGSVQPYNLTRQLLFSGP